MASTATIPSGVYQMGSNQLPDEQPIRQITLDRSLVVYTTEITQKSYLEVMKNNPSRFSNCGQHCPVDSVSWIDAIEFANALSRRDGLEECYVVQPEKVLWPKGGDCLGWRLPTEEEWEWLARGGEKYLYAGSSDPKEVAWFWDNGQLQTQVVGKKKSNGFGLYDMSGNVWEWCWAEYKPYEALQTDPPRSLNRSTAKVLRGGAWSVALQDLRVSIRYQAQSDVTMSNVGIRLVRTHLQ